MLTRQKAVATLKKIGYGPDVANYIPNGMYRGEVNLTPTVKTGLQPKEWYEKLRDALQSEGIKCSVESDRDLSYCVSLRVEK